MDFLNFCAAHGIIINYTPPLGVWKRYATTDHPKKRNGAVKFMGDHAFVQNHATDTEVSIWKAEGSTEGQRRNFQDLANRAEQERRKMQGEAANKAAHILNQCINAKHDYLKAKGFENETGCVWAHEGQQFLVIPMRVGSHLVGCQIIDRDGKKKFLYGQRTSNAEFCFDNKGPHILCEGYATALSLRLAMKSLKLRYTIHVCFSAGNMKKVASTIDTGYVIADNDESKTGENAAKEIGWPYWMSEQVGEDANDTHQRLGLFRFGQSVAKLLNARTAVYGSHHQQFAATN